MRRRSFLPSPLTRNALRQAPEAEFYVVAEASQYVNLGNPNILKLDWSLAPVQETTSKVTGVNIKISFRSSPSTVTLTDWVYFAVDGTFGTVVADATPFRDVRFSTPTRLQHDFACRHNKPWTNSVEHQRPVDVRE